MQLISHLRVHKHRKLEFFSAVRDCCSPFVLHAQFLWHMLHFAMLYCAVPALCVSRSSCYTAYLVLAVMPSVF